LVGRHCSNRHADPAERRRPGTPERIAAAIEAVVGHGEEGSHVVPLKEDGIFGAKTEQGVKTFQAGDVGTLTVDGIVARGSGRSC
jgi:peptidoglycan hydrolase-like protein with peptidoglycan-binding domain